jgi:hypothetical protein
MMQVQLEGHGKKNRSAGDAGSIWGCRIYGQRRGFFGAIDSQGLSCMFEYLIESHSLVFSWAGALPFGRGSVLLRLRESSTWGGAWRASCMKSSGALSPGNPSSGKQNSTGSTQSKGRRRGLGYNLMVSSSSLTLCKPSFATIWDSPSSLHGTLSIIVALFQGSFACQEPAIPAAEWEASAVPMDGFIQSLKLNSSS